MLLAYVEALAQLPLPIWFQVGAFPFGSIRSRRSSQRVFASPGFTLKLKSNMFRFGQSGSFTWIISPFRSYPATVTK